MKILGIEASAISASVSICEDDLILGEYYLHTGKTHSQTLMPITEQLLITTDSSLADIDAIAVTTGPGSFTGLRIALAAVKGMAMGKNIPCIEVSTLESIAYNLKGFDGIVAPTMDARCNQVYTALFRLSDGTATRLTEDTAMSLEDYSEMLSSYKDEKIYLAGDGLNITKKFLTEKGIAFIVPPSRMRTQNATSTALLGVEKYNRGETLSYKDIVPKYLRLPQAERELKKKTNK